MTLFSLKAIPPRYVLPVFLLLTFVGPIVLGPILYVVLEPFHIPFHRAMSRALLLSALGALFLFRDRIRLRQWWRANREGRRQWALGWLLAVVSSLVMIGLYGALCGFHGAGVPPSHTLLVAVVAALIVPILEETLFRGFLVTLFVEATGRWVGWFLAAMIYALAHFLKVPSDMREQPIQFWSGVTGMFAAFAQLGHGDFFSGKGLSLFLVGLILGGVFLRKGRLWIGAGLHGGWIFILMTFTGLTRPDDSPRIPFLGGDLLSCPLTPGVLLVFGLLLWRLYPKSPDLGKAI